MKFISEQSAAQQNNQTEVRKYLNVILFIISIY